VSETAISNDAGTGDRCSGGRFAVDHFSTKRGTRVVKVLIFGSHNGKIG